MSTWTEITGHGQLRSFVDNEGNFWLEQNASKRTKWGKLSGKGARSRMGVCWSRGFIHWPHVDRW